jgi:hypothetical protein
MSDGDEAVGLLTALGFGMIAFATGGLSIPLALAVRAACLGATAVAVGGTYAAGRVTGVIPRD